MKSQVLVLFLTSAVFFFILPSFIVGQILKKQYKFEEICWDYYGTILGNYYKVRDSEVCGVKCTERSGCVSFLYKKSSGWCLLNSETFMNRTNAGCSFLSEYYEITTGLPPRPVGPPDRCGLVPYIPGIIVNRAIGNYSIGSQLPYRCDPCTSYPPPSSPGYIECSANGSWIIPSEPLCVYGPDVGFLRNGSAIPVNATGCVSTHNSTCSQSSVMEGLRFDGTFGECYCDDVCCSAQDCCFDTTCYQTSKIYDYDYYYYDDYYG
ncbi:uncharacterized protein LOC132725582 [Ruditapes philippinarum]|uniref:uncharacterized protein LOC132725582 n=1 Tax=Ruditapes philippinarum TaxID=129788 RepID=UPI00295BF637|nr:uncharacterized protein LOC132725582 [Ruditapes philippinarum]